MERTKLIAIGVIVIVIGVAGVGFLLLGPLGTPTHYEQEYPVGSSKHIMVFIGLVDCNLTISFRNDSTLLYSIDVELYSDSDFRVYYSEWSEYHAVKINKFEGEMSTGPARLKSVDIVLGTAAQYVIGVGGENIDASISYGNGAKLGYHSDGVEYTDDDFIFEASGSVRFTFENDVDFSSGGLDVQLSSSGGPLDYLGSAILDIDLPEGMTGRVSYFDSAMSVDNNGWIPYPDKYQYGSGPLLDIHVRATTGSMTLNLS